MSTTYWAYVHNTIVYETECFNGVTLSGLTLQLYKIPKHEVTLFNKY